MMVAGVMRGRTLRMRGGRIEGKRGIEHAGVVTVRTLMGPIFSPKMSLEGKASGRTW